MAFIVICWVGPDSDTTGATGHSPDGFAKFFAGKIDDVRTATAGHPTAPVSNTTRSTMSTFQPCTQSDVRHIFIHVLASQIVSTGPCTVYRPSSSVRQSTRASLLPFITSIVQRVAVTGQSIYQSHRNMPSWRLLCPRGPASMIARPGCDGHPRPSS